MDTDILASYASASYLLVIEPHEALQEEIISIKKRFGETYDCASSTMGKPNITLVRFEQYEMIEGKLARRLEQVMRENKSFLVELDDFGSYPTHSIFLNVVTRNPILELTRSLRPMQHLFRIDKERKPHFITEPFISIARKLLPWQFEKGWLELSHTHFNARFMAGHVLLLRRREGEKNYRTVKRFQLLDAKETIVQGELFI